MTSPALLLLAPLLAVSFGYEPSTDAPDGYDYIVQVDPEHAERLLAGDGPAIEATIPKEVTPIRRIRVVVGTDALPRTLRPAVRSTFKPDLSEAAATPSLDLLAQTGPGFGRNATGFQRGPTGAASPTTVPSVTGNLGQVGQDLDTGFETARDNWNTARDSVRSGINNVGGTAQDLLDRTRQVVGDTITPPERQQYDANGRPLQNLAGRVQEDFQNTADAMRGAFDTQQYRADANQNRYTNQEQSVLAGNRNNSNQQQTGQLTQAELAQQQLEYNERLRQERLRTEQLARQEELRLEQQRLEQLRLERQQEEQLAAERRQREAALAAERRQSTGFPEQPLQPLPGRQINTEEDAGIVERLVDRTNRRRTEAADTWDNDVATDPASERSTQTVGRFGGPVLGAADGNAPQDDTPEWLREEPTTISRTVSNQDDKRLTLEDNRQPASPSTPLWVLGWAIAVGSVVTNLFQWLNIVDMRNKYRVALRRASPGFTRSMAA